METQVQNAKGGRRPGAGRRRRGTLTLWMQVTLPLSDEEVAVISALSPMERRRRLLFAASSREREGDVERRTRNFRVVLHTPEERITILDLPTSERRRRLIGGAA